jgi:divalent metal cation (Fe/Co/Zn/Cd) transporter
MIASFVQVFIESFERAIGRQGEPAVELSWLGLGTMLATIGIKAVLYVRRLCDVVRALTTRWIWCSRIPSSGVQALAQDAENDVWLNIMSLSFPVSGADSNLVQC